MKANDLSAAGHRGCGAWQLPQKQHGTSQKQVVWVLLIEEQKNSIELLEKGLSPYGTRSYEITRKTLEKACCEAAKGVGGRELASIPHKPVHAHYLASSNAEKTGESKFARVV